MAVITKSISDRVCTLTLNRPENSNALNIELIDALVDGVRSADRDKRVAVIALKGSGKNFCAGGDIKDMHSKSDMFTGDALELRENYKHGIQKIAPVFESLGTPVICAIQGAAIGAGLDLSCMCDIRLAHTGAKFGETFARLGLVPGDGGTFLLQRVVGFAKAMELTLTCDVIDANEALRIGLVSKVTDNLDQSLEEYCDKVKEQSPLALKLSKRALISAYRSDLSSNLELLASFQGLAQDSKEHQDRLSEFFSRKKS